MTILSGCRLPGTDNAVFEVVPPEVSVLDGTLCLFDSPLDG